MKKALGRVLVLGLASIATPALGDSVAGICPDGSAFVVQRARDVPCPDAKLVGPSELPPLRPELLPKPYMWYVDQQTRAQTNPYNLVDGARRLRALRAAEVVPAPGPLRAEQTAPGPDPAAVLTPRAAPAFAESDLRELVRLIALRQEIAPATLSVVDARGHESLRIAIAHSDSFESRLLDVLGLDPDTHRAIAFFSRAVTDTAFHPNFLVVQDGVTFRPEPGDAAEVGLLVGRPGALEQGLLVLGYLVLPARFDVERPIDVYWNDRSVSALLRP